jgi:hypothetical protein
MAALSNGKPARTAPRWSFKERQGKGRIDSILYELAVILDKPDFFADRQIGINCANGFIEFTEEGEPSWEPHNPDHRCRHVLSARITIPTFQFTRFL